MKTMPCLFNRWHDHHWDGGGTYTEHLYRDREPMLQYGRALVQPLAIGTMNGGNGEGLHPFFTKKGRLRDGLEFLTEKPALLAPWKGRTA